MLIILLENENKNKLVFYKIIKLVFYKINSIYSPNNLFI